MAAIWGHETITKRLKAACDQDEISHAYLFEGSKGIGKYTTAMYFATYALCEGESVRPCSICAACRKIHSDNQEHVYRIEPEGNSVKDAQIEMIQSLILKKSYDDKRTFIIVDKAHTMTARAQNRILKTLEDPPPKTTFVLLAENAHSMVMTILSRCVLIKFKPLAQREIVRMLTEKNVPAQQALLIASLSLGMPGKAMELLSAEGLDDRRKSAIALAFRLLNQYSYYRCGQNASELADNKETALGTLDIMLGLFRDVLLVQAGSPQEAVMNADYYEEIARTSAKVDGSRVFSLIHAVQTAKNDIGLNINIGYAFKNMLLCE